jgi:hypothetical protein
MKDAGPYGRRPCFKSGKTSWFRRKIAINPAVEPNQGFFWCFYCKITNLPSLKYPFNSEKNGLFSCHVLIHSSVSGQEVAVGREHTGMYEYSLSNHALSPGFQLVSATESRVHFGKGCTSRFGRHRPPDRLGSLGVENVSGDDPGQIAHGGGSPPVTGHPLDSDTPAGLRTVDPADGCNPMTLPGWPEATAAGCIRPRVE